MKLNRDEFHLKERVGKVKDFGAHQVRVLGFNNTENDFHTFVALVNYQ